MAVQIPTPITRASVNLTTAAVAADVGGTDKWANTGAQYVYIDNQNGATLTVTINNGVGFVVDSQTPASRTFTVPTTNRAIVGPFAINIYNDASGNVTLSWSVTASVKILVFTANNNT